MNEKRRNFMKTATAGFLAGMFGPAKGASSSFDSKKKKTMRSEGLDQILERYGAELGGIRPERGRP